jgi:chemotaxis protein CheD
LTDRDLEKYAESLREGAAYATKIFARMTRLELVSGHARIVAVDHEAPPAGLFPPGDRFSAGLTALSGDLFGQGMLVFEDSAAEEVGRAMLLGARVSASAGAALEEAANIFVNTALAALTRDFKLSVYPSPPRLARGRADETWNAFLEPIGRRAPRSVAAVVEIASPDRRLAGRFLLALRHDSLEAVRWKTFGMTDKPIDVEMGEFRSTKSPGILKAASLGSCVAVILFDPVRKSGAIAHVMLPKSASPELGRARPGKYADTAVSALLKTFPGASPSRLRVWLVGGASMFATDALVLQIGRRNLEVVKERLAAAGIVRFIEETGGSTGRTVELDTRTGEVSLRGAAGAKRLIPHPAQPGPLPAPPRPPKKP